MLKILRQPLVLFFVLWLHVTLLNVVVVTFDGAIFFWQQSIQPKAIAVHFLIALSATIFFVFVAHFRKKIQHENFKVGNKTLLMCSVFMVIGIGYLMV